MVIHDPGLHALPQRAKCWQPKCRWYIKAEGTSEKPGAIVASEVLFRAMTGMGYGDETKCGPGAVSKAMVGAKIAAVSVAPSPDKDRAFISSITLENGRTVHLAPSTKGVTVYKVTHG